MESFLKHRPQQFTFFSDWFFYPAAACLMVDALDHPAFLPWRTTGDIPDGDV